MSDLASIAAELRRVLPTEYWHLVDELVDYAIDDILKKFNREVNAAFERGVKDGWKWGHCDLDRLTMRGD